MVYIIIKQTIKKEENMKTTIWAKEQTIENGLEGIEDLIEYAHDQYTDFGTKKQSDCPEKEISLSEWFSSANNDWYLIESESDPEIIVLVGNGPYTAYRKDEIYEKSATIGYPSDDS